MPRSLSLAKPLWLLLFLGLCASGRAVNYEVYPGSAFYLTQMVDRASWAYVADNANGFYFHPVGFSTASDYTLSTLQKQTICDNFSNRWAMVEGDMGGSDPNAALGDISTIAGFGLNPFNAFINRIATNPSVWRQTVRNDARVGCSTYAMTAPHRIYTVPGGWYDPAYAYARTNTVAVGCAGSGVDAPVYLYANNGSFYRQVIWDQRDYSVANGKKFNYLVSPNNSYDQQLMTDTLYLVRTMEDNGHEPDVYGVVLYGQRPVNLTPETTNYNGVVQANWTITGLAYYLLKHRDGEAGTLDLFATATNGTRYAQNVMSPVLTNASQVVPFNAAQSNTFTLTLTNRSAWLDYAGVLRARTGPGQETNWNITFSLGGSNITSAVMSDDGYVLLGSRRLLPATAQSVTMNLSPKGAATPLALVVEILPHAGVDQALDVITFQYQTNQTPPTVALNVADQYILQGQPVDPIWFTVGDAETLSPNLTVTAVSLNTALVPNANCVLASSGIQRTLRVTPVASQWGTAPITVTVNDGQFTSSKTFNVVVERTNIVSVLKANNTADLNLTNSWLSAAVPGQFDMPTWSNNIVGANTTVLADDQFWAGVRILSPGGAVTIGGTNLLSLGLGGVDMTSASQNLTLDTALELTEFSPWTVASGRTLTVNSNISGSGGITKAGAGTLALLASNSFSGQLTVSAGTALLPQAGQQSLTVASGSGVVRASHSGAFGLGGLNITAANSETARVELTNNISVLAGKTIALNARSSSTDAIRNLGGSNTLGASISFGTGGGNYWIQSDAGQLTIAGKVTSAATGGRTLTLKGAANGLVSGVIENGSATMNLTKADAGSWTLVATNTYTGTTTVSGGTLLVNGIINSSAALTVNSNATLGGTGRILSPITIAAGGTLAPGGEAIGRLTVSNTLSLAANSFAIFHVSKTPLTNDFIAGVTDLTLGGTLRVTNLAGALVLGDSFKLFDAANYLGSFATLQLPSLSDGLTWSNRLALDGTIAVAMATPPTLGWQTTSTNAIAFTWPDYYTGFRLQMQTNAASFGLGTNWVNVPGGTNSAIVVPMTNRAATVFFRLAR